MSLILITTLPIKTLINGLIIQKIWMEKVGSVKEIENWL